MTAGPLWLAEPSRFASVTRAGARAVLLIVVLLIALAALTPPPNATESATPKAEPGPSDLAMYETIADRIAHGGSYYRVTAQALREGNYPLRPFVTFRPPLLAEMQAALPNVVFVSLLYTLVLGVGMAWLGRLREALPTGPPLIVAGVMLLGGLFTCVQPILTPSHEVWAALLIALSLAFHRPTEWVVPVALATVAMLVRELSVLYVLVMLGFAWREGRRGEVLGWLGALAVLTAATAAHAWAVSQVVSPLDPTSEGWQGFNGVWFFVQTIRHSTALEAFPYAVAVPVVVLAAFGWTGWRDPLGARTAATILVYALLIATFARLNNFYWGLMIAPVYLVGLVFLPDALRDLARAALDRRRITVTRVAR